jgi:hypothetical protein
MDNERKFQGQGNEANMSASKTCNAAPNEESQRGGQRSGFDVATTRPQTELNQAAEIGVSLPKADAAGHQTAGRIATIRCGTVGGRLSPCGTVKRPGNQNRLR